MLLVLAKNYFLLFFSESLALFADSARILTVVTSSAYTFFLSGVKVAGSSSSIIEIERLVLSSPIFYKLESVF